MTNTEIGLYYLYKHQKKRSYECETWADFSKLYHTYNQTVIEYHASGYISFEFANWLIRKNRALRNRIRQENGCKMGVINSKLIL